MQPEKATEGMSVLRDGFRRLALAGFSIFMVLLAFFLVAAAVVPYFVKLDKYRPDMACITNLKQMQGAIEQWALETKRSTNDLVSITDISGSPTNYIRLLINKELKCPAGGTYSITTVGEAPRCSVAGHTL